MEEGSSSDDGSWGSIAPKRLKHSSLTEGAKRMIVNVYNFMEKNTQQDKKRCLCTITGKTVGLAPMAVYQVLRENNIDVEPPVVIKGPAFKNISEKDRSAIRKIVYTFFINNKIPSVQKVMKAVNDDDNLPSFNRSMFNKMMKSLWFQYVMKGQRNIVNDRDKVVIFRRKYLDKLELYRKENRSIFYVDEGWIDVGGIDEDKKTLVILHIGNENGFLPGAAKIFQLVSTVPKITMLLNTFEGWFEETVSKLENAVVVLDEAPWHWNRINKIPSYAWPKANIQAWLREKNIQFTDEETKPELLVKAYKLKPIFEVNEIAKKYKVDVLMVPPFHYELNLVTSVLSEITQDVMKKKYSSLDEAQEFLKKCISKYPGVKWVRHVERVKEQETYFNKIDAVMDAFMDSLDSDLDLGSDSVSESESESSYEWSSSESD